MSDLKATAKLIRNMGFDADLAKDIMEIVEISVNAGREQAAAEIERLRAQLASARGALQSIAGFGDINLAGEWESSLRGIIRSMTDCAKAALTDENGKS